MVLDLEPGPLQLATAPLNLSFTSEEISILLAIAQIVATGLTFSGALILGWVTIIASNRTSAYSGLTAAARDVSATLRSLGHKYRNFQAKDFRLRQRYRLEYLDMSYNDLVEKAFYDMQRGSDRVAEFRAAGFLKTWDNLDVCIEEMMLALLDTSYKELDKFREDWESGSVNHDAEWRAIRAYRRQLFPNGTTGADNWLKTYERFERISAVCVLRQNDLIARTCSREATGTSPSIYGIQQTHDWINHVSAVRTALAPMAASLRSLLNDREKWDRIERQVRSIPMLRLFLLPTIVGVVLPMTLPILFAAQINWVALAAMVAAVICIVVFSRSLFLKLNLFNDDQNEYKTKVLMLREQLCAASPRANSLFNLELPVNASEANSAGAPKLAESIGDYISAARAIFPLAQAYEAILRILLAQSRIETDFAGVPGESGMMLSIVDFMSVSQVMNTMNPAALRPMNFNIVADEFGGHSRPVGQFLIPRDANIERIVRERMVNVCSQIQAADGSSEFIAAVERAMKAQETLKQAVTSEILRLGLSKQPATAS